mmetsp:Transcript_14742/g.27243  ORF Transcript_14742/g.27243 Transcript_14742/m.27243 type:complete len:214 (+) Transcript_14742:3131-3772(+)
MRRRHIRAERRVVGRLLLLLLLLGGGSGGGLSRGRLGHGRRPRHVGGVDGVLGLLLLFFADHVVKVDGCGRSVGLLREFLDPAVELLPLLLILSGSGVVVGGRGAVARVIKSLVDGGLDVLRGVAFADDLLVIVVANVVSEGLGRGLDARLDGPRFCELVVNQLEADFAQALLKLKPGELTAAARVGLLEGHHDGLSEAVKVLAALAELLRDN